MVLYDNIKLLCTKKGVSVGSVEKALKFSNGSICKWNENEPGIRKVQKLLEQEPVECFADEKKEDA